VEQDKIDETRATPVIETAAARAPRRSAPLWLQLLVSVIVIVVAVVVAVLFNPTANAMLARIGVALPQLNASADSADVSSAGGQQGASGQQRPAGGQAQQGNQQQAGAQSQGQGRQGQGQGGGQFGGRGGSRTAVVVAETVTNGKINDRLSAVGEGSAISSATITPASGGTLTGVAVRPGDVVTAGAELATLDTLTQQNALDRAKLASADADAALARAQSLAKANSIPATQLDAAQLAADNARLEVEAAQIALDQRTITTPIAGTVGLIEVTPGNLVTAQSVVTTVQDSSEILVNFWVPERYASQIAVGQAVTANAVALAGQKFAGSISAVDNKIDPDSRTLQVQATLPNPAGAIKAGMSFSVELAFPGETFPVVDPLSIQWSNEGAYVWKIADGKVLKGMVEIVQRNSDGVLVNGDVKLGDQVVTQGVLQLSDGAAVRLLDAAADSAASNGQQGQGRRPSSEQGGSSQAPTSSAAG
jgi:RND family efflux transporter MFP subunit